MRVTQRTVRRPRDVRVNTASYVTFVSRGAPSASCLGLGAALGRLEVQLVGHCHHDECFA